MVDSVDPDQTAPIGTVCSGYTLFASILNLSVMLCSYLQQTTSADDIYRCIFLLGALRVNSEPGTRVSFIVDIIHPRFPRLPQLSLSLTEVPSPFPINRK